MVDDESNAIRLVEDILSGIPEIEVTDRFTDPVKALVSMKQKPPDLLFLDIQMPRLSGFDLLKSLRTAGIPILVIFVTAYDQYAIEAFHEEAFDYLLKPVSPEEVKDAVGRLLQRVDLYQSVQRIDRMLSRMDGQKIQIPDRNGINFYDPADILYIEADGNYSTIHLKTKSHLVTRQIGSLEEMLSEHGFVRTCRSVLINPRYLTRLDRKQHTCILDYEGRTFELPVSEDRMRGWG